MSMSSSHVRSQPVDFLFSRYSGVPVPGIGQMGTTCVLKNGSPHGPEKKFRFDTFGTRSDRTVPCREKPMFRLLRANLTAFNHARTPLLLRTGDSI